MSYQFLVDIETLATKSDAVILSAAAIAVDFEQEFNYQDLINNSIYVKFDAKSQTPKRRVDKDTLDWWKKQDFEVIKSQLMPSDHDVSLEDGFALLKKFFDLKGYNKETVVWTRGVLDGIVLEDIAKQLEVKPIYHYFRERDVRTAIDILSGSNNGYCETTKPIDGPVFKHNPISDCIIDAFMLKYYKEF